MLKKAACLSFAAGVFIGIGGSVFLSCDNKYMGAVLFAVALLTICYLRLYLFTGKIGYLAISHTKADVLDVVITLIGNFVGTLFSGLMVSYAKPALMEKAAGLCSGKLQLQPLPTLVLAFFCGILMYTAVAIYREKQSPWGIFFCVPVFILSGFEHSIADMFYFFTARMFTADVFLFLAIVVLGNTIGGMFIPAIRLISGDLKHE
ncbi:MAG: formate/nitrite transporter family protein [Oscillospiraceae bacterium]|nr:formate/nitrite transporter family protein [Oscillospiraceae bacterium]